jgi:hypothetical protein
LKTPTTANDSRLKAIGIVLGLFLLAFLLAGLANRVVFHRFFVEQTLVFDAGHYFAIAREGYINPAIAAFYPLWPALIKFAILPFSSENAVLLACLFSFALFASSLILWSEAALKDTDSHAFMLCSLSLFALNPNSLFHILPYTESLTSLLGALFLFTTGKLLTQQRWLAQSRRALLLFSMAVVGMSLSRPVALPLSASVVCAVACTSYFSKGAFKRLALLSCVIILLSWLAYIPFGLHTQNALGSFFAPFDAQKYWDRKLGFYWDLFFQPKSVSSSDNVLFWDLQAFYLPTVLLVLPFLGKFAHHRHSQSGEKFQSLLAPLRPLESLGEDFLYWTCAFFAAAHAALAFLTYPIYMSLGRHVFALPFYFYCLASLLRLYWHHNKVRTFSIFYAFLSFAFLVYWWSRYARVGWLG